MQSIMANKEDENAYAVAGKLPTPMENISSKDNICYNQVLASESETKPTTMSTVTRECSKDKRNKLIITIVVILLVLCAICVCTIYTQLELSRFKAEIISSYTVLSKTMNASLDDLHQQINDLSISIQQIQVRK